MRIILVGLIILFLAGAGALLSRDYYVKRKFRRIAAQKFLIVEPLMRRLESNDRIPESDIRTLVSDPSLRCSVYGILKAHNREHLFPREYLTHEKAAESYLVNWLEYPTELGMAPSEIQLINKVIVEDKEPVDYYVFKYRTQTPHWAAKNDWMIGVSGPYAVDAMPYDVPIRVFSRFSPVDSISPGNEVRWVHQNIKREA